ncbi:hypothetical protein AWJ20_2202 [Sugiyamaella lignohabitans]|uniref:Auxin efflux carrier n=1 Tax=Sugiyamaella lignohabitans TaxID=796027 RepID=A0A161HM23_9ASCO|nr:uncharacterized protein AWJ20_2202 [Sugiyamaella lignohabitans]ANB14597.1 hypothetical protein AWJ20_2202 [Sugiyamaella lignohabitans]
MAAQYVSNISPLRLVSYSFSDEGEFPHFATVVTEKASNAAIAAAAASASASFGINTYSNGTNPGGPDDHISYLDLSFLTLQAVSQTVIICLFGYFAARAKILTPAVQRQVSMLNVQIFTPCLIFSKLASSLSLSALVDIAIIPVLFVITTGISMLCAKITSRIFRFNLRESNFVTAMAVFGNSNSLPVSLTVSLAYTLPSLAWPDIPDDNQDDVASRGILYLLIFQQLGQILRWSWGYNTLLAKPKDEDEFCEEDEDDEISSIEEGAVANESAHVGTAKNKHSVNRKRRKQRGVDYSAVNADDVESQLGPQKSPVIITEDNASSPSSSSSSSVVETGFSTRVGSENGLAELGSESAPLIVGDENTVSLASPTSHTSHVVSRISSNATVLSRNDESCNASTPLLPQTLSRKIISSVQKVFMSFLSFMNPPLWSMVIAIIVASIPAAKHELFETNGFVNHAITGAVTQVGGIAIPMILVVLGSNLAPDESTAPASKRHSSIVFASLISRMILPSIFLLPIIALSVKYIKLSILDDPIFLLVAFILTISPPAIQLSQISQLNGVFEKEMASVLFWGYVVLTLPSTIAIVVASLEVLDWAGTTRS